MEVSVEENEKERRQNKSRICKDKGGLEAYKDISGDVYVTSTDKKNGRQDGYNEGYNVQICVVS